MGSEQLRAPDALAVELRAGRALAVETEGPGVVFEIFHGEEPPADLVRRASATVKNLRLDVPSGRVLAGVLAALPFADRSAKPAEGPTLAPGVYSADLWAIRTGSRRDAERSDNLLGFSCVGSMVVIGVAIGLLFAKMWWTAGSMLGVTVFAWLVALVVSVIRDERRRQLVVVQLRGPEETPPAEGGTLRSPRPRNR